MLKYTQFSFLILFVFCLFLNFDLSAEVINRSNTSKYLKDNARKRYKEKSHEELVKSAKSYQHLKLKIPIEFRGELDPLSALYEDVLPLKSYYHFSVSETSTGYYSESNSLPVVLSRKRFQKIFGYLNKIDEGAKLELYGIIKKMKKPGGGTLKQAYGSGSRYYFYLEDVGFVQPEEEASEENIAEAEVEVSEKITKKSEKKAEKKARKKADKKARLAKKDPVVEKKDPVVVTNNILIPEPTSFKPVNFVNREITFTYAYKSARMAGKTKSLIRLETHWSGDLKDLLIYCSASDRDAKDVLDGIQPGDCVEVTGTIKEKVSKGKSVYYILAQLATGDYDNLSVSDKAITDKLSKPTEIDIDY